MLAAGIIKLAAGEKVTDLSQLQITDAPPLFADDDQTQHRKSKKTGIRNKMQQQYSEAFGRFYIPENTSIYIRDSMQDILLQPLKHHIFFTDYFDLFREVKIQISFSLCSTVVVDFDLQQRVTPVPKDGLREIRDNKPADVCNDVFVDDQEIIPVETGRWTSFLANRENKKQLIRYLSRKLEEVGPLLKLGQTLLISRVKLKKSPVPLFQIYHFYSILMTNLTLVFYLFVQITVTMIV